ncbi:MAG TPA: hypothetical protein VFP89_05340 [Propionibacteriaceae bacterium]|nr:hypothetical protein [Propionibacteriaceae bacterium]
MDLESVAGEVYGVAPEEFLPLRSERASQAKEAGDRALAKQITQLRKPTRAAWLVNLLAREAGDELRSLLDLGAALREAHQNLSGPELRRLSSERYRAVDALARRAAAIGSDRGHQPTDSVRQEVAQTLQAALADPSAAELVSAGRVVQSLSYGGFGTGDPRADATPAANRTPDETPAKSVRRTRDTVAGTKGSEHPDNEPGPTGPDDAATTVADARAAQQAERRRAAEEAVALARQRADAAVAERDTATSAVAAAEAEVAQARERVEALRLDLANAESAASDAAEQAKRARDAFTQASARAAAAQQTLSDVEGDLAAVSDR